MEKSLLCACQISEASFVREILANDNEIVDVNCLDESCGKTPLHFAGARNNAEIAELLLSMGATVDARDAIFGDTALHLASRNGNIDVAKILLKFGAQVFAANFRGETPFFLAFSKKRRKTFDVLLKEAYSRAKDSHLKNYLDMCRSVARNNCQHVQRLAQVTKEVNFSKIEAESPLFFAVVKNNVKMAGILLENGAKADFRMLDYAILNDKHMGVIELLLKNGVDLETGFSLGLAARLGRTSIVELLIKFGAKVDAKSQDGQSALYLATKAGFLSCAEVLLEKKAKIEREIFNLALETSNLKFVELFLRFGVDPNDSLHFACLKSDFRVIRVLVDSGVDLERLDESGKSVLHFAARNQNFGVLELLLKSWVDFVNSEDNEGNTPIQESRSCENFATLVRYGAEVKLGNFLKKCDNKNCEVVSCLGRLELLGYQIEERTMSIFWRASEVDKFQEELENLKSWGIGGGSGIKVTLYDVLFMKRNGVVDILENMCFRKVLEECRGNFATKFPFYGFVLNLQCRNGERRRSLKNLAKKTLNITLGMVVPENCGEMILRHLSNVELKHFGQLGETLQQ